MPRRTSRILALALATMLAAVAWAGFEPAWIERAELTTADLRSKLLATPTERPEIRLILAGEKVRDQYSFWPPPRELYKTLIDFCKVGGARALIFAVSLPDPYELDGQDEKFAMALEEAGHLPIIFAIEFDTEVAKADKWPQGVSPSPFIVDGVDRWTKEHSDLDPFTAEKAALPVTGLAEEIQTFGNPGLIDSGETVRRIHPFVNFSGHHVPFLGLAAQAMSKATESMIDQNRVPSLAIQGNRFVVDYDATVDLVFRHRSLPLDDEGRVLLRFREFADEVSTHLYPVDVLYDVIKWHQAWTARQDPAETQKIIDPRDFADAYVFYGLEDQTVRTPIGELTKAELQALLLDNLLSDDFLAPTSTRMKAVLTFILALAAGQLAAQDRRWTLAALAACLVIPALGGVLLYKLGVLTPIVTPTLATLLTSAGVLAAPLLAKRRRPASKPSAHRSRASGEAFDVFLSHNSRNKDEARELCDALEARGVRAWLDEREIRPGERWQDALEGIVKTARSAAVLVGPDGLGPWHDAEMQACLVAFNEQGTPLIPVLLPGAPSDVDLPIFLRQISWVDLRHRDSFSDEGLDRLIWGITGTKP